MVRQLASYDPSNGKLLGEVQVISPEKVADLVTRAQAAARSWRKLDATNRVSILEKAYVQAQSRTNELAVLLSCEKVDRCLQFFGVKVFDQLLFWC